MVGLNADGKTDLVGLDAATGTWRASFSRGDHGTSTTLGTWSTTTTWTDTQWADVDGDSRPDLVARASGTFNVATWMNHAATLSNGPAATLVALSQPWSAPVAAANSGGSSSSSSGSTATTQDTAASTTTVPMSYFAARFSWVTSAMPAVTQTTSTASSSATASTSSTTATTPTPATTTPTSTWSNVLLGDVTGDGKADLVTRSESTGAWSVAVSQGDHAATSTVWSGLSTSTAWSNLQLVDLDGDQKADLLGRSTTDGAWWAAFSTGTGFRTQLLGVTDPGVTYGEGDVIVADYNGDGKKDVGIRRANGQLVVGLTTGSTVSFDVWTTWPTDPARELLRGGLFA